MIFGQRQQITENHLANCHIGEQWRLPHTHISTHLQLEQGFVYIVTISTIYQYRRSKTQSVM